MKLVIYVDPLPKKNPGTGWHGKKYNPRNQYIKEIRRQLLDFWGIEEWEIENPNYVQPFPQGVPVGLDVDFVLDRPDRLDKKKHPDGLIWHSDVKKKDLDNLLKPFKDAVNKILWYDDSQVCALRGRKFYREKSGEPRISISLQQLSFTPSRTVGETLEHVVESVWDDFIRSVVPMDLSQLTDRELTEIDPEEAKRQLIRLMRQLKEAA